MKAKKLLKKLNYLPRWAWYLASLSLGGPIGALFVYLGFHALDKMAKDEEEEDAKSAFDWDTYARYGKKPSAASTYQDEECIVTDDIDVADEWARTEESAHCAKESAHRAKESAQAPFAEEESESAATGEIADVVREVNESIRRIRRANDLIPDPALSDQLYSIENSCTQILAILKQRPQLLTELRSFLRYYLPTTLKLLDARVRLDKNANTPKAREVRQRISEALGVIDQAFLKQLEALDEYRFIDLESEMDVLRDMLRADGLTEESEDEAVPLAGH